MHLNDVSLLIELLPHALITRTNSFYESMRLLASYHGCRSKLLRLEHFFLAAFLFNGPVGLIFEDLAVGGKLGACALLAICICLIGSNRDAAPTFILIIFV